MPPDYSLYVNDHGLVFLCLCLWNRYLQHPIIAFSLNSSGVYTLREPYPSLKGTIASLLDNCIPFGLGLLAAPFCRDLQDVVLAQADFYLVFGNSRQVCCYLVLTVVGAHV